MHGCQVITNKPIKACQNNRANLTATSSLRLSGLYSSSIIILELWAMFHHQGFYRLHWEHWSGPLSKGLRELQTNSKHYKELQSLSSCAVISCMILWETTSNTDTNTRLPDSVSFHNKHEIVLSNALKEQNIHFVMVIIGKLIFAKAHLHKHTNDFFYSIVRIFYIDFYNLQIKLITIIKDLQSKSLPYY